MNEKYKCKECDGIVINYSITYEDGSQRSGHQCSNSESSTYNVDIRGEDGITHTIEMPSIGSAQFVYRPPIDKSSNKSDEFKEDWVLDLRENK